MAHAKNITVEAELGVLSGKEDDLDISEEIISQINQSLS